MLLIGTEICKNIAPLKSIALLALLLVPPFVGPIQAQPIHTFQVVTTFPHEPSSFTQGLDYHEGRLFEGVGLFGESKLLETSLDSGEILKETALDDSLFGEGIVVLDNSIYQLTWRGRRGFVYDRDTFELIKTVTYPTEGWGLTHNGTELIMSEGTDKIRFRNPETFKESRTISVKDTTGPITRINELEYIRGEIWANIWLTDRIARIDPETGAVTAWIDCAGLFDWASLNDSNAVLNGIAYDEQGDRIFLTGKLWPHIFEVKSHSTEVPHPNKISSFNLQSNSLQIEFTSSRNVRYQAEVAASTPSTDWTPIAQEILGTGHLSPITLDRSEFQRNQFIRIISVP